MQDSHFLFTSRSKLPIPCVGLLPVNNDAFQFKKESRIFLLDSSFMVSNAESSFNFGIYRPFSKRKVYSMLMAEEYEVLEEIPQPIVNIQTERSQGIFKDFLSR